MYYYIEAPPVVQKRIQRQKRIYELECLNFQGTRPMKTNPFLSLPSRDDDLAPFKK